MHQFNNCPSPLETSFVVVTSFSTTKKRQLVTESPCYLLFYQPHQFFFLRWLWASVIILPQICTKLVSASCVLILYFLIDWQSSCLLFKKKKLRLLGKESYSFMDNWLVSFFLKTFSNYNCMLLMWKLKENRKLDWNCLGTINICSNWCLQ